MLKSAILPWEPENIWGTRQGETAKNKSGHGWYQRPSLQALRQPKKRKHTHMEQLCVIIQSDEVCDILNTPQSEYGLDYGILPPEPIAKVWLLHSDEGVHTKRYAFGRLS